MATEQTITPSAGNAPFPTQGGVGASPGFDAIDFRRFWSRSYVEGVASSPAWKVSESAVLGMTVTIAADSDAAFVQGDSVADQGLYYVAPHSGVVTLDVAPADATNPRVDLVVLQVFDSDHDGSGEYAAKLRVLEGTPTAGATLDNAAGAVTLPDTALLLARVLVGAGATQVTNVGMRDFRDYALKDAMVGEVRFLGNDDVIPDGFLPADNAAVKRDQFARAFGALSTKHGAGDGTTTFNLPDAQGRHLVGKGAHADVDTVGKTDGLDATARTPKHKHWVPWVNAENGGNNFIGAITSGDTGPLAAMGYTLRARVNQAQGTWATNLFAKLFNGYSYWGDPNQPGVSPNPPVNNAEDPHRTVAAQYYDADSTVETAGFLTMQAVVFVGSVATPA